MGGASKVPEGQRSPESSPSGAEPGEYLSLAGEDDKFVFERLHLEAIRTRIWILFRVRG